MGHSESREVSAMVLGRMTSGPTAEEEARLKETDREVQRAQARVESASHAAKVRPGVLGRIRALVCRG